MDGLFPLIETGIADTTTRIYLKFTQPTGKHSYGCLLVQQVTAEHASGGSGGNRRLDDDATFPGGHHYEPLDTFPCEQFHA